MKRLADASRKIVRSNPARIGLATAVAATSSYVLAKVVAVSRGPQGIGELGACLGAISLVLAVGQLGLPNALPAAIGHNKRSGIAQTALRWTWASSTLSALALCGLMLIARSGGQVFTNLTLTDILWLGFASMAGLQVLIAAVLGAVLVRPTFSANLTMWAAVSSTLISSSILFVKPGASVATALGIGALGTAALALYAGFRLRRLASPIPNGEVSSFSVRRLARLAMGMWVGTIGAGVAYALYPVITVIGLGAFDAGLVRAGMSLAIVTFYLGSAFLSNHYYPVLAASAGDPDATSTIVRTARRQTFLVLLPLGALIAVASPLLLRIFYSPSFMGAIESVVAFSLAFLLRFVGTLNSSIAAANHKVRAQGAVEWTFAVTLMAAVGICALITTDVIAYLAAFLGACTTSAILSELLLRHYRLPSVLRVR